MQQILRKCCEYSENWILGTVGGLRKFEQFLALSKMFCIIGFELVFVFPTVLCKYRYKCQGLDLS